MASHHWVSSLNRLSNVMITGNFTEGSTFYQHSIARLFYPVALDSTLNMYYHSPKLHFSPKHVLYVIMFNVL